MFEEVVDNVIWLLDSEGSPEPITEDDYKDFVNKYVGGRRSGDGGWVRLHRMRLSAGSL